MASQNELQGIDAFLVHHEADADAVAALGEELRARGLLPVATQYPAGMASMRLTAALVVLAGADVTWLEAAFATLTTLSASTRSHPEILLVRLPGGDWPRVSVSEVPVLDLAETEGFERLVAWITTANREARDTSAEGLAFPSADQARHALVDELAKVLSDPDMAVLVAKRAGYPPGRLPVFTRSIQFWSTIVEGAERGIVPIERLIEEALHHYPYNPTFIALAKQDWSTASPNPRASAPAKQATAPRKRAAAGVRREDAPTGALPGAATSQEPAVREPMRIGAGVDLRREVSSEQLVLDVCQVGRAIATVLANADGELCFALYGPWGRGKTTLAKQICGQLRRRTDAPRYRTVWFNAWKYRSPAEVWAHLYERLAHAAGRGGALARPTHAIRANLSRQGLWPLTIALLSLAVALVPMSGKLELAAQLFMGIAGVLTALGAVWFIFAFRKTAGVMSRVWKLYGALPSHRDQLGLQATIGDDLRHLLRGWISEPYERRDGPTRADDVAWPDDGPPPEHHSGLETTACALGVYAVMVVLLYAISTMGTSMPILYMVVPQVVVAAAMLVAGVVIRDGRKAERVLLVVDDLDRCSPALMLEILESIKLLVEERGICERLQVMVLVDEEMLFRAVADRFEPYVSRASEDDQDELRRRLVREHLDKIFLSDFRLGRLSQHDVATLVERFASVPGAKEEAGRGETPPSRELPSIAAQGERSPSAAALDGRAAVAPDGRTTAPPPPSSSSATSLIDADDSITFSRAECDALVAQCQELLGGRSGHRLGPRAIRSMILRYQLARLLLNVAGIKLEPALVASRIVSAALQDREVELDDHRSTTVQAEAIIEQVVGIDYFRIDSKPEARPQRDIDPPTLMD